MMSLNFALAYTRHHVDTLMGGLINFVDAGGKLIQTMTAAVVWDDSLSTCWENTANYPNC